MFTHADPHLRMLTLVRMILNVQQLTRTALQACVRRRLPKSLALAATSCRAQRTASGKRGRVIAPRRAVQASNRSTCTASACPAHATPLSRTACAQAQCRGVASCAAGTHAKPLAIVRGRGRRATPPVAVALRSARSHATSRTVLVASGLLLRAAPARMWRGRQTSGLATLHHVRRPSGKWRGGASATPSAAAGAGAQPPASAPSVRC